MTERKEEEEEKKRITYNRLEARTGEVIERASPRLSSHANGIVGIVFQTEREYARCFVLPVSEHSN